MKGINKKLLLMFIVIGILAIGFGCAPKTELKADEDISINYGFLTGLGADANSIEIEFDGETHNLKLADKELLSSLVLHEFYIVAYTKDGVVKSIQTNPNLKELVLNSMEEKPPVEMNEVEILAVDKVNIDHLTLLNEYIFDFDNDGIDEKIGMYTAAQKDDKGEIMWDDGQEWIFIVQDTDKDYVLFNDYVQLGSINFYVYTIEDDFYIATLSYRTASLTLTTYHYDPVNKSFIMTVPFNTTGNVNMLHTSYGY